MDLAQLSDSLDKNFGSFTTLLASLNKTPDALSLLSETGYVGIGPLETQPGDSIAIFQGARVPYIIHKENGGNYWTLIGEAHVYGIVDGEFMATNPEAEDIILC